MKQVMKELKKCRYTTFALVAFLILLLLSFFVYQMFFGERGKPVYGNRLDGIDKVMVDDAYFAKISETLEKQKIVSEASGQRSGRILNYTIVVKDKTKTKDAKALTNTILESLSKDQVAYFDIQVFFTCEKEMDGYPMIGYKNKENKKFSY